MRQLCYIILFFFCFIETAQSQTSISGHVYIHNSKTKTGQLKEVPLVSIKALGGTGSVSDVKGYYFVSFGQARPSTLVTLTVSDPSGMQVVNHTDMKTLLARTHPLDIYLARSKDIETAAVEFYNISKDKLFAEKNATIKRLQGTVSERDKEIKLLEIKYGKKLENATQAEELLEAKLAEMETKLPEFASKMAETNLDFASDIFKGAYIAYQSNDIEQAIALLDNTQLKENFDTALQQKKNGTVMIVEGTAIVENTMLVIQQLKDSWYLKAKLYELKYQFTDALKCYEEILNIQLQNNESEEEIAETYFFAAYYCYQSKKADNFSNYTSKVLSLWEKTPDKYLIELAATYDLLGRFHTDKEEYKVALQHMNKAIKFAKKQEGNYLVKSRYYSDISEVLSGLKQYKEGMENMEIAIGFFNNVGEPESMKTSLYNQYAMLAFESGDTLKARHHIEEAIVITEQSPNSEYTGNAGLYMNYGYILLRQGDTEKASIAAEKALNQILKREIPDYFQIALCYRNLAEINVASGNINKANFYLEKSEESILKADEINQVKGKFYFILADVYEKIDQLDKMAAALENTVVFFKKFATDGMLADLYMRLAITYAKNNQLNKVLPLALEALDLKLKSENTGEIDIALFYVTIGAAYEYTDIDKAFDYHKKALLAISKTTNYILKADIYYRLAKCNLIKEEYNSAVKYYEDAITLLQKKQNKEATTLLAECYAHLANAYYYLSKYDQALLNLDKAKITYDANNPIQQKIKDYATVIKFEKATDSFDKGDFKKALADFNTIENFQVIDSVRYMMGRCYYNLGSYDLAIVDFDKAAELSEIYKDNEYYSDKGLVYTRQDKFMEAEKAFKSHAAKFPDNASTYRNWGVYYIRKGDETLALQNLQKALNIEPKITKDWLLNTHEFDKKTKSSKAYKKMISSP